MREYGTKTTPVFLPADGEASWSLLPSSVSLLSGGTVQPENTYSSILRVTGQVWESQKRISINTNNLFQSLSSQTCSSLFLLKLHAWMYNTQPIVYQWCNLTIAQRFWVTKVYLWASKIPKIRLLGCPTEQVTSWKANFENYSRYLLIKWY